MLICSNDTSSRSRHRRQYAALISAIAVIILQAPLDHRAAAAEAAHRASVTTPSKTASGIATENAVRGVIRSFETAAITAELNARILQLPWREGDKIAKGDLLVEFDCRRATAERDAAAAQVRAHQIAHRLQRKLHHYKAAGSFAVEQAKAELDKSDAELRSLDARLSTCRILAPFDGRIAEKNAHVHEIAQPNQPLVKLVNDARLEMVLMVPSSWLATLRRGDALRVRMDESGMMHDARILQATGIIDPVSQSARVIAEIVDVPEFVAPGMSGTAYFARAGGVK